MKKSEATPFKIQMLIDANERLKKAKVLYAREKDISTILDGVYCGKSTDNTNNYDREEINAYIGLP